MVVQHIEGLWFFLRKRQHELLLERTMFVFILVLMEGCVLLNI